MEDAGADREGRRQQWNVHRGSYEKAFGRGYEGEWYRMLKIIESAGQADSCPDQTDRLQSNTVLVEVLCMYFDYEDIYLFVRSGSR